MENIRLNLISKLTDEGINLAGVVRILDMREQTLQLKDELESMRDQMRAMEEELHEYRVQERITAIARYEGNPEQMMRKLLGNGSASTAAPEGEAE